jgi:short-subunit dehydrogenase
MSQSTPLGLITGASSGIGRCLVDEFVNAGYDLIVCAEDDGVLRVADEVGAQSGRELHAVQTDLRDPFGIETLWKVVTDSGRPLAAAALNAGVGQGGAFVDTDIDDEIEIIRLNVESTVRLAKLVLRDMAQRDEGKVLITSSIASTMPGSYQAVYNASKSFLQSFAEAVQDELRDTNVTITSLMPGPTDTNFFERAGMAVNTRVGRSNSKDDPAKVAAQGFTAMEAGRRRVVASSPTTKVLELVNKATPDIAKAFAHRLMAQPK